jgi:MFS family permease
MQLFKALRRPAFALLWSGQTISRLGDSLYRVALAWWVVEKTGSAVAMGVILTFTIVPMLVLLLLGGVLVDRLPRLPLLLGSDAGSGILVTAMALLSFGGWLEVWQVCLFALFFGAIDAFFHPAYRALLPEITPGEDLTSANSLTSLSEQLCGIIGPALGAFIVALVGSSTAFALNAASCYLWYAWASAENPPARNAKVSSRTWAKDWRRCSKRPGFG